MTDQDQALFDAARRLTDSGQRRAFLDAACGDDAGLRRRLDDLLSIQREANALFERPAEAPLPPRPGGTVAVPDPDRPPHEGPGTVIGRYKLLERIGEGGFGAVYVAEQREPVKRRVALKIIKLGMDTRQVVARFEAERQALALMDHPSIAKVFDAGTTASGRPYFVMELVRGVPITQYCDESSLTTFERLGLFTQVCHAIQHAHQKGIIHRDIKPSNILVTLHDGMPVPKVIDFGIAKATQQELTEKTVYTQFHQFIGTPAYMSPEQAEMSGLDIDTRSDIYGLGVLLYELLTGRTPFDGRQLLAAGLDEMRRILREQEPTRPSTRLSTMLEGELTTAARHRRSAPLKLISLLRGDLDWIVMKCLEKDRSRRYATANALAHDIDRHLRHEPVLARPPSASYRIKKFVRRNQVMVTAAAVVATVLVLGIVMSTWQAVRATHAEREQSRLRDAAERARDGEADQRRQALEARAIAEQQQYFASIALADNLIEQEEYARAKQVLARSSLAPLRGWEWGWLERACNPDLMTLDGGGPALSGVAFSPDGRLLATGCFDGSIRLWDLATGSELQKLEGHTSIVLLLGFSPDGRRLATGSWDQTAKVWDVATGRLLFTLLGHTDWVYCAVFSPDGKTIATGSRDRTVRLWDAKTGVFLGVAGEYGESVMCVAFSPDGRLLGYAGGSGDPSTLSSDTSVRIVELQSGESRVLTGHTSSVPSIAFSPDGDRVATASWDMTARWAWARTDTELHPLFRATSAAGAVFSVAFSPDSRLCVAGGGTLDTDRGYDLSVRLIEVQTGREVQTFKGHSKIIRGVAFSPEGHVIASTSFDGTAKLWPATPPPEFLSLDGHDQAVWTAAVSPTGRCVATGSLDHTARIWDLAGGQLLMTLPVAFPVVSLAFGPDGRRLVTVADDASAKVWNLELEGGFGGRRLPPPEPALVLAGHSNAVMCVAYSPCGRWIATGSKDNTARIWDAGAGRLLRTLEGHRHWVLGVAFSPDGSRLATASADRTARVWETETGRRVSTLKGHQDWVLQVTWSPDSTRLATGGQDETARLWDAATGAALLVPMEGHIDGVSSLSFSPDGRRIATAGGGTVTNQTDTRDIAANLWDVATGENLLRLAAHRNVVRAVVFSTDGMRLITGSLDHTARVRSAFAWRPEDYPGDSSLSLETRLERYKAQYWSRFLTTGGGTAPNLGRRVEGRQTGEVNIAAETRLKTRPSRPIPARDPHSGPGQIDLSEIYNAALNEPWLPLRSLEELGQNLSGLPAGLQDLDGVVFDARGVIQLRRADPDWAPFPDQVRIPLGRSFGHLHVLHGTAFSEREATVIGLYVLHYADGQAQELEIRYGRDVREWSAAGDPSPSAGPLAPAWTGSRSWASTAGRTVELFTATYVNPRPQEAVRHIDFVSRITGAAPFLVAMTLE